MRSERTTEFCKRAFSYWPENPSEKLVDGNSAKYHHQDYEAATRLAHKIFKELCIDSVPEPVSETRTWNSAAELQGNTLMPNDKVVFWAYIYIVEDNHLTCPGEINEIIFDKYAIPKEEWAEHAYGYAPPSGGAWPSSKTGDYEALTRLTMRILNFIANPNSDMPTLPSNTFSGTEVQKRVVANNKQPMRFLIVSNPPGEGMSREIQSHGPRPIWIGVKNGNDNVLSTYPNSTSTITQEQYLENQKAFNGRDTCWSATNWEKTIFQEYSETPVPTPPQTPIQAGLAQPAGAQVMTVYVPFDKTVKDTIDSETRAIADRYINEWGIEKYLAGSLEDKMKEVMKELRPVYIKMPAGMPDKPVEWLLHEKFDDILFLAKIEKQVMIVGPAGTGKTTTAHQVADALSLNFGFISCTGGMPEAALTGRMLFDGTYVQTDFVKCYENGWVFLLDEVDAADSNTLLIINSALANGHLSLSNRKENPIATRHPDFICICAANTYGNWSFDYAGRNILDKAFLDRFAVSKVFMGYDEKLEASLSTGHDAVLEFFLTVRRKVEAANIREVVSTRAIASAIRQTKAGAKFSDIKDRFFLSWSKDNLSKVK